jgi:hypothetical protein
MSVNFRRHGEVVLGRKYTSDTELFMSFVCTVGNTIDDRGRGKSLVFTTVWFGKSIDGGGAATVTSLTGKPTILGTACHYTQSELYAMPFYVTKQYRKDSSIQPFLTPRDDQPPRSVRNALNFKPNMDFLRV